MVLSPDLVLRIEKIQKSEIEEHLTYSALAKITKDPKNRKILEQIAADELRHYGILKEITQKEFAPSRLRITWYSMLGQVLGLSFTLRLMEKGEDLAQESYAQLRPSFPQAAKIFEDEEDHETKLLGLISEERLEYAGSIVLGLNDALVELTGALAGLTFALQAGQIIGVIGLVTGLAASMSMAASGYLSSREENSQENGKEPLKSAIYTGVAYVLTVLLLVLPYFLFSNVFLALGIMLSFSIAIIAAYTFYITTAKNLSFRNRFLEMALISLTVAAISFGIGILLRSIFGIDM